MAEAQTLSEKIISAHTGRPVQAGEIVVVRVSGTMSPDAGAPFTIGTFREMGGQALWDPGRVTLVIDHAAPPPNERIARLHDIMRAFARETGCRLFDVGDGICHQLIVEHGLVGPGDLFVGGDSHTPTYGALGAFAVGMGATDIAGIWLTGQTWIRVPHSVRVDLHGALRPGVFPKDIVLALVGRLKLAGAVYQALEYTGPALDTLDLSARMTLANMAAETGAKTALMPPPDGSLQPDAGAAYLAETRIDLDTLEPLVSLPGSPDRVVPLSSAAGTKIDMAFIGTCTNGRLEDLQAAARILAGRRVAPGVRLIIAPASRAVLTAAMQDGTAGILSAAGATFLPSGCGPCAGTHQGVPGDGEVVLSSGNRNFPGRMGNRSASVYLGSPAVVAAAALAGEITDPTPYFS